MCAPASYHARIGKLERLSRGGDGLTCKSSSVRFAMAPCSSSLLRAPCSAPFGLAFGCSKSLQVLGADVLDALVDGIEMGEVVVEHESLDRRLLLGEEQRCFVTPFRGRETRRLLLPGGSTHCDAFRV